MSAKQDRDRKNKMQLSLPSDTEILLTREFEAPAEMVFEVFTTEKYIARWFAPSFVQFLSCRHENRVGGTYEYVIRSDEGQESKFSGVIQKLEPPHTYEYTEVFSTGDFVSPESLCTAKFTDLAGGRCRLSLLASYDSKETRDAVIDSGMEGGAADSYDLADAVLAELTAARL